MSLEGLLRTFLKSQLGRRLAYMAQQTILGQHPALTVDSDQRHASF